MKGGIFMIFSIIIFIAWLTLGTLNVRQEGDVPKNQYILTWVTLLSFILEKIISKML